MPNNKIPILPIQHSNLLERIEVDTLMKTVTMRYIDGKQDTRGYTEPEFKDSIIIFDILTANRAATIKNS